MQQACICRKSDDQLGTDERSHGDASQSADYGSGLNGFGERLHSFAKVVCQRIGGGLVDLAS